LPGDAVFERSRLFIDLIKNEEGNPAILSAALEFSCERALTAIQHTAIKIRRGLGVKDKVSFDWFRLRF
jgi:hypothetical protein